MSSKIKKGDKSYPKIDSFFNKNKFANSKLELAQSKAILSEKNKSDRLCEIHNAKPAAKETENSTNQNETSDAQLTSAKRVEDNESKNHRGNRKANYSAEVIKDSSPIIPNTDSHAQFTDDSNDIDDSKKLFETEGKLKVVEKELKYAKQMLKKSTAMNFEKELKIKQLLAEENDFSVDHWSKEFVDRFEEAELKKIRSIGPGKSNDSKFILHIMRCLYKGEEVKKLENRTSSGRKYKDAKKMEISFEKRATMQSMLKSRVVFELKNKANFAVEMDKRINRINELMKNAIHNISRTNKKRQREDDVTDDNPNKVRKVYYFHFHLISKDYM